eukprot:COSAG05_NODE_3249_length_2208_cov_9.455570_2_plen_191_part_00
MLTCVCTRARVCGDGCVSACVSVRAGHHSVRHSWAAAFTTSTTAASQRTASQKRRQRRRQQQAAAHRRASSPTRASSVGDSGHDHSDNELASPGGRGVGGEGQEMMGRSLPLPQHGGRCAGEPCCLTIVVVTLGIVIVINVDVSAVGAFFFFVFSFFFLFFFLLFFSSFFVVVLFFNHQCCRTLNIICAY